jgi:hypothetical protein
MRESKPDLPAGLWYEAIPPEQLRPANLHEAMLRRRLGPPEPAPAQH